MVDLEMVEREFTQHFELSVDSQKQLLALFASLTVKEERKEEVYGN